MHQSADRVFGLKPDANSTRECIGHKRWVADLDELDRDWAIGEPVTLRPSKLRGQARFSGASRPQDGEKTGMSQQTPQFTHFLLASDEGGKPHGETRGERSRPSILVVTSSSG